MALDMLLVAVLIAIGFLMFGGTVALNMWVKKTRTDAYHEGYETGFAAGASVTADALRRVRKAN